MMATRRWLMTQYDWTGLAKRFYASPKWEVGAFLGIAFFVIALLLIFRGPVVTDRVELTTFAPVHLVHLGDQIMLGFIFLMLFSNAFHMYRKIMQGTRIPLSLYLTQAPVFFLNYFTQKRWRKCGTGPGSAWWLTGALGVLAGVGILSFYSVIAGWTIANIYYAATGAVTGDSAATGAFFSQFVRNAPLSVGLTALVLAVTSGTLLGGVKEGREPAC